MGCTKLGLFLVEITDKYDRKRSIFNYVMASELLQSMTLALQRIYVLFSATDN